MSRDDGQPSAALWREYCAMPVEEYDRRESAPSWRDLPPTEKQLSALRRSRWAGPEPKTRGAASDAIGWTIREIRQREAACEDDLYADFVPRDYGDL